MAEATFNTFVSIDELPVRLRIAALLDHLLFGSLLVLLCLAAIPYGTSQPWWKALFICSVLLATIFAASEFFLSGSTQMEGKRLVFPILSMAAYAYLQTLSLAANSDLSKRVISADPYATRFVATQLVALALVLLLLFRYVRTETRVRAVIHVVLGVAVVSAVYGIVRQSIQRETGFILPLLRPGAGYGQFINKNHFAYLMEMAFGLAVGLLLSGVVRRRYVMVYVAVLLPIWTALILSNSRGGILAMFTQIAIAVLLAGSLRGVKANKDSSVGRSAQTKRGKGEEGKGGRGESREQYEEDLPRFAFSPFPRFLFSPLPLFRLTMRVAMLVILVIAVAGGVLWVGGDRLISNFEATGSEFSISTAPTEGVTRNEIWRATLRSFAAHPVVGVGLGGYSVAITAHHEGSGKMTPQEAHNEYLELLASGGIVGFAIGLWFAFEVARLARSNLRASNKFRAGVCFGAVLGISAVAVHSFFDFGLHLLANATVFCVLIVLATRVE